MVATSHLSTRFMRLAFIVGLLVAAIATGTYLLSRADGPVWVFAGGPFRSGEMVAYEDMDWDAVDELNELEMEIVGASSSRTLWFSVHDGSPYVACDLDCVGGLLNRWPQQIERDGRIVIRVHSRRVEGRLVHVPHDSDEYEIVQVGRRQKYSGDRGARAAAETAAHGAVVGVGETLTGRASRDEPGDRLYRIDPRPST